MSRILFAAELGGGLGHLGRLLPVAQSLEAAGYEPLFAVPSLSAGKRFLPCKSEQLLQAPVWRTHPQGKPFQAATYADILARHGYAQEEELAARTQAWSDLITEVNPRLIVADYSPTVCLAASGAFPIVVLGDGFTVPPLQNQELPRISEATPSVAAPRVLQVIRAVQRKRGRPIPTTFREAFPRAACFLVTYQELDPYRVERTESFSGPLLLPNRVNDRSVKKSLFAYLDGAYSSVPDLLVAAAAAGLTVSAYVRNLSSSLATTLRSRGVNLSDRPFDLNQVLPHVSAVVHHGGLNTSTAAFAAGVPQLLLPRYLEQNLNARALEQQGVGQILGGRHTRQSLRENLQRLVADSALSVRAQEVARVVVQRSEVGCLPWVVECCRRLAA